MGANKCKEPVLTGESMDLVGALYDVIREEAGDIDSVE